MAHYRENSINITLLTNIAFVNVFAIIQENPVLTTINR